MGHVRALCWVAGSLAGAGLLDGGHGAAGLHQVAGMAVSYLCFAWYRRDSDARGFARPRWLSVGMAGFAVGAIPYYLLCSRTEAERGAALAAYAGCLAAAAFAAWAGIAVRIGLA